MRNPLVHLGTSTLWYGLGQVLNRFITFLLLPVLTKYLTPSDYGITSILGLVGLVVIPSLSLGFDAGAGPCYFESNQREHREATIGTEAVMLLFGAIVLAGASWWGAENAAQLLLGQPGYGQLLAIWMWGCCFEMVLMPCRHYLMFEQRVKLLTVLNMAATLLTVALTLMMVIGQHRGLTGMVMARTWGLAVAGVLFYGVVAATIRFRWSNRVARDLLRIGLLFLPTIVLLVLLQHGNRYLLQHLRGPEEAGLYFVGFSFGLVMAMPVTAFQTAWYPFFMTYVERRAEARTLFGRILSYYVLGFGCLCILCFLAARPVVHIMTQSPFHAAFQAVGLTALSQFLIGMFYVLLPGMYLAKEPHAQSLILVVSTGIAVGLNWWLITWFDMLGAGVALALSALFLVALTHAWNRWRGQAYLQVQYEWKRIGWFGLVLIGYASLSLADPGGSVLREILTALGLVLPLPVIVYALLRPEERQALRRFVSQKLNGLPRANGLPLGL